MSLRNITNNKLAFWVEHAGEFLLNNPQLFSEGERSYISASYWRNIHLECFRILQVIDRRLGDVIPLDYADPAILRNIRLLFTITKEDLSPLRISSVLDWGHDHNIPEMYVQGLYKSLQAIEKIIDCDERLNGELSQPSREAANKEEAEIQSSIMQICDSFLHEFTGMKTQRPSFWRYETAGIDLKFTGYDGRACTAESDGVIFRYTANGTRTPYIVVECKKLDKAPGRSGYESTLPQKAAELLALSAANGIQRVYGIEISHTYISFWNAYLPDNYFELLATVEDLPLTAHVLMKRTRVFDLSQSNGRENFARGFLSLLMFLSATVG